MSNKFPQFGILTVQYTSDFPKGCRIKILSKKDEWNECLIENIKTGNKIWLPERYIKMVGLFDGDYAIILKSGKIKSYKTKQGATRYASKHSNDIVGMAVRDSKEF